MPVEPDPERIEIPLVMLPGNMQVLLNNQLSVQAISLKWSEEYPNAVVLLVHGVDQEQAAELGFQTKREGGTQ